VRTVRRTVVRTVVTAKILRLRNRAYWRYNPREYWRY
jgi:hypothetical protein